VNVDDIAIRVRNLGKRYRIGEKSASYKTFRDAITNAAMAPFRRHDNGTDASGQGYFWALKDVSFDVEKGDVIGIIGRNGAGKSTLLKILSRITEPTEGRAELHGRVGSLLEVGTGFHPELTGQENIFLSGSMLGMKKSEIERKFDEIVKFSQVDKFIDTPLKHYSSGMQVRLGFAVAAYLEPEILMIDEVLAVGDAAFQKKCLGKMENIAKEGRTILFVSHNMAAVENLCTKGIVLNQGKIQFIGSQTDAISKYLTSIEEDNKILLRDREDRRGSGSLRIIGVEIKDAGGNPVDTVISGQDVDVFMYFENVSGTSHSNVIASIAIKTQMDIPVCLQHNRLTADEFGELPESGAFVCRLKKLPLPSASYRVDFSIQENGEYLDGIANAFELNVIDGDFYGTGEVPPVSHGVCLIQGNWRIAPSISIPDKDRMLK
jgi:lipopolysaccharide transport system ATP-binding protein